MPHKNKYTCLIIDDEPLAIKVIKEHLDNFSDQFECVGMYTKPIEAMSVLNKGGVDLLFLDINMPSISGIEFLKALPHQPYVIFTTAYREFAVDAFDLNALDYLVKPISTGRFLKGINKFLALEQSQQTRTKDIIHIKADKKHYNIPAETILYIEGLDNYIKVKTTTSNLICYESLSGMEKELSSDIFLRIHRSFIININQIEHYTSSYIKIDERQFTIGRNYKEQVLNYLERQ
ncbi:LytR/AlgR family response regulator transcription factor [Plebeiibacterium marinum]|uniref:LytTR family DNA-binding domain-containing protein n=1 Tax=Plebeiibacterium marinum TaxID=2992111 RepID=A0AAE3SIT3_9BACT|nr:LytTR family DNA-binding domain-containing protein [Plebeiobacterium marinum]MCW3804937.1 LytTR family DNA-binding domain-containing protein [Plebeiobacterium marinum]